MYSNFPSNCKRSLAMSTRSYSVTLTTAMFKIQGASDLIAPSHASFPSHAPSILPCLVTCTLWPGKPFSFRSVASNSIARFKAHYCTRLLAKTLTWASTSISLSKAMFGACPPIGECGCTLWHSPWSHTPPPQGSILPSN
jgi:hypothetical protein